MHPTYRSGIDYFTPAVGTKKEMSCQACKGALDMQPDILITRGRFGQPYSEDQQYRVDVFTCRHAGEEWHSQIIALMREIDKTSSQKLSQLLESEIEEIRSTRKNTKKLSAFIM